jgi:hypothetical protein
MFIDNFFYLRQKRKDLVNRLTIHYFNTVGFLPTKTPPPDYGSARATVPLWPWLQVENKFKKNDFVSIDVASCPIIKDLQKRMLFIIITASVIFNDANSRIIQ